MGFMVMAFSCFSEVLVTSASLPFQHVQEIAVAGEECTKCY